MTAVTNEARGLHLPGLKNRMKISTVLYVLLLVFRQHATFKKFNFFWKRKKEWHGDQIRSLPDNFKAGFYGLPVDTRVQSSHFLVSAET